MHLKLFCPLVAFAIAPSVAVAQTHMPAHASLAAAPSPSSPAYQSAFVDYQPYKEPVVMSWRQANDQVRDAGGMQGRDMATMKSQSADPHAGHDMSKKAPALPSAAVPAPPGVPATAEKASVDKARNEDPHAGHDMSKMTPTQPRTAAPAAAGATANEKRTNPASRATPVQRVDPHAGHDMSRLIAPAAKKASGTDKAAEDGAQLPHQPNNKEENE